MVDSVFSPRSALHSIAKEGRYGKPTGCPGVRAHLLDPLGLVLVMPARGKAGDCLARLASIFGDELTHATARRLVRGEGLDLVWAGPNQYLAIMAGETDLAGRIRELCGDTAAVIDQSDGRFALRLTGPCVRQTLAKGISIDLHPRVFVPGETALVQLVHSQMQLTLVDGSPTFDLIGPRAAAGDVWSWLLTSAGQFGLEVDRSQSSAAVGASNVGDAQR